MAKRIHLSHDQKTRDRIKTSQLINRLTDHALGKIDLVATQVRAIEVLLKKTVPDLQAISLSGPDGGAIQSNLNIASLSPDALREIAALKIGE